MWPLLIAVALSFLVVRLWADSLEGVNKERDYRYHRFLVDMAGGISLWSRYKAAGIAQRNEGKAWSRQWENRMAAARQANWARHMASLGVRY